MNLEEMFESIRREKSVRSKIARRLRSRAEEISLSDLAAEVGLSEHETQKIVDEMLPRMRGPRRSAEKA